MRLSAIGLPRSRLSLDQRSARILGTALASYCGRFGSTIAILVNIPLVRASITPDQFGVWMMLTALLAFFAFADLGIGNGVLNRATAALARGDRAELRCILAGGYACTATISSILLLGWAAWTYASAQPTAVAGAIVAEQRHSVLAALHVFVVLLAINVPAGLVQKLQLASQQGAWIGATQLFAAFGSLIAVSIAAHVGGGLVVFVCASLGMQVLGNLLSTAFWLARSKLLQAGPLHLDRALILSLVRTGLQFLALQLAVAFAFQSDAIVITQVMGQAAYGNFAIVQRLFGFVSALVASALLGLWPAIGDALTRGEYKWVRSALLRAYAAAGLFSGAAVIVLIISFGWITRYWLRTPIEVPSALLVALGTWCVIEALGSVSGALLNGANVLRPQVITAIVMAAAAFGAKWLFVPMYGTAASVLATIVAYLLTSVPLQIYLVRTVVASKAREAPATP